MTPAPVFDHPTRRLTSRTVRSAAFVPVLVLGAIAVLGADGARLRTVAAAIVVVVILAMWWVTRPPVWNWRATATRPSPVPLLVGTSTVVGTIAVLLGGSGLDVRATTIVFGAIAVVGTFALPSGHREALAAIAVGGWVVVLPASGVDDPVVLAAQSIGAVLLAVVAWRDLRSLEAAVATERRAAESAVERAGLLATLLRLQSLEPDAVLDGVVEGAASLGFASVLLLVPEGGGLRLAADRTAPGEPPPPSWIRPGEGIAAEVLDTRRTVVVEDDGPQPKALARPGRLRGAVACPVLADGEVVAVLLARRIAHGVSDAERDTVVLLAEEAGAALARAQRFAADAAVVAELRRLDGLTQDFVSTVSHELRTPMTVIAGLGQTLHRRWDDLSADRRADLLRRIDSNAERLATMVRSLIDTSALERGQLSVVPASVPLVAVVGGVRNRLAPLFERHQVVSEVGTDLVVVADGALLTHVIENLLANVAQHTPEGTRVTVSAQRRGEQVEVAVADDGPGIAADELPHVTERFYRAGATGPRRTVGGLGLGLALAEQILQAHGVRLRVRSEVGVGTTFSFVLPAAPSTAADLPPHPAGPPAGDGGPSAGGPPPPGGPEPEHPPRPPVTG